MDTIEVTLCNNVFGPAATNSTKTQINTNAM